MNCYEMSSYLNPFLQNTPRHDEILLQLALSTNQSIIKAIKTSWFIKRADPSASFVITSHMHDRIISL